MKRFLMALTCALTLAGCTDYRACFNEVIKEISSDRYNGRSVYGDGDVHAAMYLIDRLSEIDGVVPCPAAGEENNVARPYLKSVVEPSDAGRWNVVENKEKYLPWLQHFQFPMNVMRGAMSLSVDGVAYAPTFDFTVKEFSPTCHGFFKVTYLDEEAYRREGFIEHLDAEEAFGVLRLGPSCRIHHHNIRTADITVIRLPSVYEGFLLLFAEVRI